MKDNENRGAYTHKRMGVSVDLTLRLSVEMTISLSVDLTLTHLESSKNRIYMTAITFLETAILQ